MPDLLVVTGTDTGVGKTWVSCRLAAALKRHDIDVIAVKPLESGTAIALDPEEDGVRLARATGQSSPDAALRRYRAPLTPADAAVLEGGEVDMEAVEREMLALAAPHTLTLIEGAGGLLAPLTSDRTVLDIAVTYGARVLVVAANRLGMLNHTRLTLAALDAAGVTCVGVVVNTIAPPHATTTSDPSIVRNLAMLREVDPGVPLVETTASGWEEVVLSWLLLRPRREP